MQDELSHEERAIREELAIQKAREAFMSQLEPDATPKENSHEEYHEVFIETVRKDIPYSLMRMFTICRRMDVRQEMHELRTCYDMAERNRHNKILIR